MTRTVIDDTTAAITDAFAAVCIAGAGAATRSVVLATGGGMAFVVRRIDGTEEPTPEESPAVAAAVPKRRAEFAAGRWCAHEAMRVLGVAPAPLLAGPDRAPCWPAGVVGSISHTDGVACALVGAGVVAIGIDVERTTRRVDSGVWRHVLGADERARLAREDRDPRVVFSAKETFFKFAFARVGRIFDFAAASVTVAVERGEFALRVCEPLAADLPVGRVFTGRFLEAEPYVLTWLWE
jgi:4'-phosphopantetheinyl transferase EntD